MQASTIDRTVAVLAAIGALIETIVSFAYWGVSALFVTWVTVVPLAATGEQAPYGPVYAVLLLALGIAGFVFAFGAWGGYRWARDLGIILYSMNLFAGLLYMALYPNFMGFTFLTISGVMMSIFFLAFLLTRTGTAAFSRRREGHES